MGFKLQIINNFLSLCPPLLHKNLSPSSCQQSTPNHFWFGSAQLESIFAQINSEKLYYASVYLLTAQTFMDPPQRSLTQGIYRTSHSTAETRENQEKNHLFPQTLSPDITIRSHKPHVACTRRHLGKQLGMTKIFFFNVESSLRECYQIMQRNG